MVAFSKLALPPMASTVALCVGATGLVVVAAKLVFQRDSVTELVTATKKRVLFWRSMHRRFENQRLDRLNSVGQGRHSNWMWRKVDLDSDAASSDGDSNDAASTDGLMSSQKKLVLVMVGLPARGKSFVVRRATRYIEWMGFPTKVFNVGNFRRQLGRAGEDASFFSAENQDATRLREDMAMSVLDELLEWLDGDGHVAVFDATNTTIERRQHILDRVASHRNVRVMFVESICDNAALLDANYRRKCSNDDYSQSDPERALSDFIQRVREYEKVYQTVEDSEDEGRACYVKVYNAGEKIQARFCQGFLQSHIVSLLQNIHLFPRRIWLVRPGASTTSERGILGLDTDLSPQGHRVAKAIGIFMARQHFTRPFEIWTSAMKRSRQTASYVPTTHVKRLVTTTLLNELGGGDFEGLTHDEIRQLYPKHARARENDKLRYRYPGVGGESYVDVISRLRSLIIEFERKKRDVLVICNESILRCLLGYFVGIQAEKVPFLDSYQHTVIELSPHRDGCDMKLMPLDMDAVRNDEILPLTNPRLIRTMST
jgi:broad specificity phosphatase PhoE/predicted kinase